MFGGQAIRNRERSHLGCTACLGDQPAVTEDGAGAITPAVEVHQNAGGSALGDDRPFARNATNVDDRETHVLSDWPDRADLIKPLTTLRPANWPRLRAEKLAN